MQQLAYNHTVANFRGHAVISPDIERRGRVLTQVFETLERIKAAYCVLHGYQSYPYWVGSSDVDCIVRNMEPAELASLFVANQGIRINARLVHWRGAHFVFLVCEDNHQLSFLCMDFDRNYDFGELRFRAGGEIVESRISHSVFYVPSPHIEFSCYLARRIVKRDLDYRHGRRLSELYALDPQGSETEVGRLYIPGNARLICDAARSGNWDEAIGAKAALRGDLLRRLLCRHPVIAVNNMIRHAWARAADFCRPKGGLVVAFLGPDGVGKSSVISSVAGTLRGPFNHTARYGFAPGVLQWLRPQQAPNERPHGLSPRSTASSVARAVAYWLLYYSLYYRLRLRLHAARSTLVLHDRHLLDAIVDPKRYRYQGPIWLLRLIWRFVPQPDVVILLDAPTEVIQGRKQEVQAEETARQRMEYQNIVAPLKNGHVVSTDQPLEVVVDEVNEILVRCLTARVARRVSRSRRLFAKIGWVRRYGADEELK